MKTKFIFPEWLAPPNVKALTSTRVGGFSQSPYQGLNVGDHVGDDMVLVNQNRQALCQQVSEEFASKMIKPKWLRQEHTVNIADQTCIDQLDKQAFDGFLTSQSGEVCAVMTADCLPVFISDRSGTQVALVHAGWRGLADGIVESAIARFAAPPNDLLVHCGPAISQANFEVGDDVKKVLGGSERFYLLNSARKGHYFCDLKGILGERLSRFGVEYSYSQACTYENSELFYSYRRDGVTGRMVSMLWIEE